jgi:hypothetical protein
MQEVLYRHPELSVVSLAFQVDTAGVTLPPGSWGTVVHVFPDEKAYIVEFAEPIHAVLTVEAASIKQ